MIRAGASRVCAFLMRNASLQAYTELTESETLGVGAQSPVLVNPLG